MLLNILISIIILYLFSWLFVFIDDSIDDLYYFLKGKLNKNKSNISYKNYEDMIQSLKNSWVRDKYLYIYRFFLHIKDFTQDFYLEIKWFIQRGIRGYSDRDVWEFKFYLSEVITKGLKDLKNQVHGVPCEFASKDGAEIDLEGWKNVLNEIVWVFEVTKKIQNSEWFKWSYKERKKKSLKKFAKKENKHIMTSEEIKRYNNGWKLLQKYYFSLWD